MNVRLGAAMRQFEDEMVGMEGVEELDKRPPAARLNGLSAVVTEAEVYGAFALDPVEHHVDRGCRERGVCRVAGNVGLVDLDAGGGQSRDLGGKHVG